MLSLKKMLWKLTAPKIKHENKYHYAGRTHVSTYYSVKEPTDSDLVITDSKIMSFEKDIDKEEFRRLVVEYTQELCRLFKMESVVKMDKLVEDAYQLYLLKLYHVTKYIYNEQETDPDKIKSKMMPCNHKIVDLYPMFSKIYRIMDLSICSIAIPSDEIKEFTQKTNQMIIDFALGLEKTWPQNETPFSNETIEDTPLEDESDDCTTSIIDDNIVGGVDYSHKLTLSDDDDCVSSFQSNFNKQYLTNSKHEAESNVDQVTIEEVDETEMDVPHESDSACYDPSRYRFDEQSLYLNGEDYMDY